MPQLEFSIWFFNLCVGWSMMLVMVVVANKINQRIIFDSGVSIIPGNNKKWFWF